jgi:hypothetical protein
MSLDQIHGGAKNLYLTFTLTLPWDPIHGGPWQTIPRAYMADACRSHSHTDFGLDENK